MCATYDGNMLNSLITQPRVFGVAETDQQRDEPAIDDQPGHVISRELHDDKKTMKNAPKEPCVNAYIDGAIEPAH